MDYQRITSANSRLLQAYLREQKEARSFTAPRPTSSDDNITGKSRIASSHVNEDRQIRSSPAPPSRLVSASGPHTEMGARQMDAFVAKLHNENFDLKMEIDFRRRRTAELEAKLINLQPLEAQNAELCQENEKLKKEITLRESAIHEAVGMICDLEDQIFVLAKALDDVRSENADGQDNLLDDVPPTRSQELFTQMSRSRNASLPLIPLRSSSGRGIGCSVDEREMPSSPPPAIVSRHPSFLHQISYGSALRNLYLSEGTRSNVGHGNFSNPASRTGSPLSRDDNTNGDRAPDSPNLDSPRLSVLSESSFISVYGGTGHIDPNALGSSSSGKVSSSSLRAAQNDAGTIRNQVPKERVSLWMDEQFHTSCEENLVSSLCNQMEGSGKTASMSVIEPESQDRTTLRLEALGPGVDAPGQDGACVLSEPLGEGVEFAGPMFAGHMSTHLPPTPDTMSTNNQDRNDVTESGMYFDKVVTMGTQNMHVKEVGASTSSSIKSTVPLVTGTKQLENDENGSLSLSREFSGEKDDYSWLEGLQRSCHPRSSGRLPSICKTLESTNIGIPQLNSYDVHVDSGEEDIKSQTSGGLLTAPFPYISTKRLSSQGLPQLPKWSKMQKNKSIRSLSRESSNDQDSSVSFPHISDAQPPRRRRSLSHQFLRTSSRARNYDHDSEASHHTYENEDFPTASQVTFAEDSMSPTSVTTSKSPLSQSRSRPLSLTIPRRTSNLPSFLPSSTFAVSSTTPPFYLRLKGDFKAGVDGEVPTRQKSLAERIFRRGSTITRKEKPKGREKERDNNVRSVPEAQQPMSSSEYDVRSANGMKRLSGLFGVR